jgi:hypothetical protein
MSKDEREWIDKLLAACENAIEQLRAVPHPRRVLLRDLEVLRNSLIAKLDRLDKAA